MRKREEHAVPIPMPDSDQVLEGIFVSGADDDAVGMLVAAPHPEYGGSMDSPVVNELAFAAREAGLASLRFNWRGVGASAGRVSGDVNQASDDYHAALLHLLATVPGAAIAAGYSFGAATAARVAASERRVRRLALVAPPAAMLDVAALGEFPGDVLLVAAERDAFAPAAELERVAASLPRATFSCVAGADHFFATGLSEIARVTRDWLASPKWGRSAAGPC